jgi:RNA polymerase sigma factor FliA
MMPSQKKEAMPHKGSISGGSANLSTTETTKPLAPPSSEAAPDTPVVSRSSSIRNIAMNGGTARAASDVVVSKEAVTAQDPYAKGVGYLVVSTAQGAASHKRETEKKSKAQDAQREEANELWRVYALDRSNLSIRDKLVMHYLYLVKYTVGRLTLTLPNSISHDDIISYGTIGLLDAIRRFEPERGWKFETFAVNRIRGEVIDQLRSQDWVPRGVRKRSKQVSETLKLEEERLGRPPTDEEMAEALGVTVQRYTDMLNESNVLVLSLDEQLGSDRDSNVSLLDTVADRNGHEPDGHIEEGDVSKYLASAITTLPEREKLLIALYYQENMTLREIGEIISISESRVCQLHAQAIMRLRHKLSRLM